MPLLTSRNIWCPCLPHRLICNTFCCCFHLANMARVNNNSHFLLFLFVFIKFVLFLYLFLSFHSHHSFTIWYRPLDGVSGGTRRTRWGGCGEFGARLLLYVTPPPPPLLLSSSSSSSSFWSKDLVVAIPQRHLRSLVYSLEKKGRK